MCVCARYGVVRSDTSNGEDRGQWQHTQAVLSLGSPTKQWCVTWVREASRTVVVRVRTAEQWRLGKEIICKWQWFRVVPLWPEGHCDNKLATQCQWCCCHRDLYRNVGQLLERSGNSNGPNPHHLLNSVRQMAPQWWRQQFLTAIQECPAIILILCPHRINSKNC